MRKGLVCIVAAVAVLFCIVAPGAVAVLRADEGEIIKIDGCPVLCAQVERGEISWLEAYTRGGCLCYDGRPLSMEEFVAETAAVGAVALSPALRLAVPGL